ncbi:MAG TPA: hypothetical protein VG389_29740 [Myxococcota bacterium]|nr:hypothetical protein [Myxococcota bacterium]
MTRELVGVALAAAAAAAAVVLPEAMDARAAGTPDRIAVSAPASEELRVAVERGRAGVVAAGGVDLLRVTLDAPAAAGPGEAGAVWAGEVRAAGGVAAAFSVAAGARVVVTLARPVAPAEAGAYTAAVALSATAAASGSGSAGERSWTITVPGARVAERPVLAVVVDPGAAAATARSAAVALGLADGWEAVVDASPGGLNDEWPAYEGWVVAADEAAARLVPREAREALERHAAAGRPLCLVAEGGRTRCWGAAAAAPERGGTVLLAGARRCEEPGALRALGAVGFAASAALALVAVGWPRLGRGRGAAALLIAVPFAAAAVPFGAVCPPWAAATGWTRPLGAEAGAEVGAVAGPGAPARAAMVVQVEVEAAAPLGGELPPLGAGRWWVRRPADALGALVFAPLFCTSVPGPGRWRVEGVVPDAAGAGPWTLLPVRAGGGAVAWH